MWTEEHRPADLRHLALPLRWRREIEGFLRRGEIPHLVLLGPPGSGKTSLASILIAELAGSAREWSAPADGGVRMISDEVIRQMRVVPVDCIARRRPLQILLLDDMDNLSKSAWAALRRPMERYHERTRLIFTGNAEIKDKAILDRCVVIYLDTLILPVEEKVDALHHVASGVGFQVPDFVLTEIAVTSRTMREAVRVLQSYCESLPGSSEVL